MIHGYDVINANNKWRLSYRFELSAKMREACLILKNHLNDGAKSVKSKEVVRTNHTNYILFKLLLEINNFKLHSSQI